MKETGRGRADDGGGISRLERLLFRIDAQHKSLGWAFSQIEGVPGLVFELGLAQYLLGEDDAAVARLREAQLLDLHPNRGNDRTNALVRAAAAGAPNVVLADLEALLRDASPNGLVGYELVADACHLQPGARRAELDALVPVILRP